MVLPDDHGGEQARQHRSHYVSSLYISNKPPNTPGAYPMQTNSLSWPTAARIALKVAKTIGERPNDTDPGICN